MTAVSVKDLEAAISSQQELVERQGDVVRSLKAEVKEGKVLKHEVDAAIEKLKVLKIELDGKLKEFQVRVWSWQAGRGIRRWKARCGPPRVRIRGDRVAGGDGGLLPVSAGLCRWLPRCPHTLRLVLTHPRRPFPPSCAGGDWEILVERQGVVPRRAGQRPGAQNVLCPSV